MKSGKPRIINHNSKKYLKAWNKLSPGEQTNGAYFYSQEICENIIPYVKTDRNWVTVRVKHYQPPEHSIIFVHNNVHPEWYDCLNPNEHDYVLVCMLEETRDLLRERLNCRDKIIYLPLSVDVDYLNQFRCVKTREVAFAGRRTTRNRAGYEFDESVDYIEDLPREEFLKKLAEYKYVYAIGRYAIEAKALGCEILPFSPRFPDPNIWQVLDNHDAVKLLQSMLDEIDER